MIQAVAQEQLARVLDVEPLDVDALRLWFGLTQKELASILGRDERTIARWKAASKPTVVSSEIARSLRKIGRVKFLLEDLIGHESALEWLQSPNAGFRGEAPIDLMLSGRIDSVIEVLEMLADGGAY